MLFGEKILDYWDDILKDLATVVAIPSVAKPQEGEHPFGDQCARALDTVVAMAEGYGLKAKNVGYHAAHAEYGEGEGNAVVMAHLDVVPAGKAGTPTPTPWSSTTTWPLAGAFPTTRGLPLWPSTACGL